MTFKLQTSLLALLYGCAVPLASPRAHWHEVQSPHFVVYTDLPQRAAEQQTRGLEKLLWALHRAGWEATGDLPVRVNVVMFSDPDEFHAYGGQDIGGYTIDQALFEPWIVMPAPTRLAGTEVLAHELTHFMADQAIQAQPKWFAEGLACYFQTAGFVTREEFEVGRVPRDLFEQIRHHGFVPPSDLLADLTIDDAPRFYASAWLLVHYLMSKRPDEFVAYQEGLSRGAGSVAAFRAAFPGGMAVLDHAVEEYVRLGFYDAFAFRAKVPEVTASARALTRADEHALRALLSDTCFHCTRDAQRTGQDLTLALKEQPDHLRAGLMELRIQLDAAQKYRRATELTAAHPDSWLAQLSLGFLALQADRFVALAQDPRRDPGAHALRLAPQQAFAVMLAAYSHRARDELGQALTLSAQAERMQPTNLTLLQMRLDILVSCGRCEDAHAVAERMGNAGHMRLTEADIATTQSALAACRPG